MDSFTQHYTDMQLENVLDEGLFDGLWKLMNTDIGTLFKTLKPKTIKINNLNKMNPADVDEVSNNLFSHIHKMLATDLMAYKKQSRDKKWVDRFLMKKKDVYVTDVANVILNESASDEFSILFDLSDKYLINAWSIYKISNGGKIQVISVSDPYLGSLNTHQVPTKGSGKLKEKLKNLKYFLVIDKKAEKWFVDKSGMLYKQFLVTRTDVTKDELDADLTAMRSTYEEVPTAEVKPGETKPAEVKPGETKPAEVKPGETKPAPEAKKSTSTKVINLPNGRVIKRNYEFEIPVEDFNKFGFSTSPSNFKTKLKDVIDSIEKFDTDKLNGKMYNLKDGGQITLLHHKLKDKYFITADKSGENAMYAKKM